MIDDVADAVAFYTTHLGFTVEQDAAVSSMVTADTCLVVSWLQPSRVRASRNPGGSTGL
jgi:catechol 2,3-dioxygenase-like lactoylglutathione lyase family enzyme